MIEIHRDNESLAQYEKHDYEFSINARKKRIAENKQVLETIREEAWNLTLREAMTSNTTITDWIPDLFIDEIIMLNQRANIVRNLFTLVGQNTQSSFKQRYRWKNERPAVTSKELQEFKHTESERSVYDFSFLKIMSSSIFSLEGLEDTPIPELAQEMQLSASHVSRTENQLMAHRLAEWSTGTLLDTWGNWQDGSDSSSSDSLIDNMITAYLELTTRLADSFDASQLTWLVSPTVFALLFRNDDFRRWDITGQETILKTGKILGSNQMLNIPLVIWEPGHFDTDSVWMPDPFDVYLIATKAAANVRIRSDLRTTPLNFDRILAQSVGMWERLIPYIRNPRAYIRIAPNEDISNIIDDMSNIHIESGLTDSDGTL